MCDGWIRISRSITSHWLWEDAERLKWWLDLLLSAEWRASKKLVGGQLLNIERGQLIASVRTLQERWAKRDKKGRIISKPSERTILGFLRLLEQEGMILRQNRQHLYTFVTICNYERYQIQDNTYDNTCDNTYDNTYTRSKLSVIQNVTKSETTPTTTPPRKNFPPHPLKKEYNSSSSSARAYTCAREGEAAIIEQLRASPIWKEQVCMLLRIQPHELEQSFGLFKLSNDVRDISHMSLADAKRHFVDWLRIQIKQKQKNEFSRNDSRPTREQRLADYAADIAADFAGCS